jgi:CDP-4-dehydro-6-deoxyglucose reductase
VRIEPGGHRLRVGALDNVLSAALAVGLPIPHSCRAGRCASCKSKLVSGRIEYPAGTPPGITAAEISRGEVLLCQAQPRSDLVIEARRVPAITPNLVRAELLSIAELPLSALELRVRLPPGAFHARPGQYLDVRDPAGDAERLAVIGSDGDTLSLECLDDSSLLRRWLDSGPAPGSELHLAGPHDRPR